MASAPPRKKAKKGQHAQAEGHLRRPAAAVSPSRVAAPSEGAPSSGSRAGSLAHQQCAGALVTTTAPVATPARKSPKPQVATAKGAAVEAATRPVAAARLAAAPAAAGPVAPVPAAHAAVQPSISSAAAAPAASSSCPASRVADAPPAAGLAARPAPVPSASSPLRGAGDAGAGGIDQAVKSEGLAFLRLSSDCSPTMSVERLIYLDKDEVTFGRMPSNTVLLDSARVPQMVSRVHGRLMRLREDGKPVKWEWVLHDNKSLNGILVNGQPIDQDGRRLQQGDLITFGRKMVPPEFEFVFELPASAGPATVEPDPAVEEAFAEHARRIAELQQELEAERERKIMESQQRAATRSSALDFEDIQSELLCSICQDWVVHASTIECSHTFCWSCVDTWLLQKKFECPVCRQAVTQEPVRVRAIETIVQKTVERGGPEGKAEYQERVSAADRELKKVQKLHQDLEKSVNDALKKGKAFFHIDSSWSRREKDVFQRGVKDYTGDTRETYCRLTGLTVSWVHSADDNKLNQALHNLGLQAFVSSEDAHIRKRLLMFLRYG